MKVIPQLEPQAIFYNRNKFGISRSIEILHSIIDNESEIEKRKVAIKYLGLLKDNSCFPIFENLLVSDENIIIKCEAAKALGRLKLIRGLKPLKWALENNSINNELKKHILRAIEKIRFEDSEIKLFIKHLNCQDKSIKTCIKNRLINLGPLRLINILLEFLKVKNIPENYEITLVKLMGYELSMLSNNNLMVLNKIHDSDEDSVKNLLENKDFLVELLTSVFEEDDYQLLKSTLLILKYLGPKIENILINFLYKEDIEPIIKKNAIILIGKLKIKESVNLLLHFLKDEEEDITLAAIQALGDIGEITTVPKLLIVLDIESQNVTEITFEKKQYIIEAVKSIYMMNEGDSYHYLFYALRFDNPLLRQCVASIMGELGKSIFLKSLLERLEIERDLEIKQAIILAIGNIGGLEALDPLLDVLYENEAYWILKKIAISAIGNIYKNFRFPFNNKDRELENHLESKIKMIVDYLSENREENYKIKLCIIKFLENHGTRYAVPALLKQLNNFYSVIRIYSSKAIKAIDKRKGK